MPKDKGAISWKGSSAEMNKGKALDFKKFCLTFYPLKDKTLLGVDLDSFSSATRTIFDQIEKFREKILNLPVLSVVVFWVESMSEYKMQCAKIMSVMQDLIANGFVGLKDEKGNVWTLRHMTELGHDSVIEALRCNDLWHIDKTEEYVRFYIDFVNWLSEKTFAVVPKATDPDLARTAQRRLSHEDYIALFKNLDDREGAIAQLMYFGGARTLEEIMDLKVENVKADYVTINDSDVIYPKHVMKNIHAYINGRKKGYVFVGKKTADKLDGTLPYRALKTVIAKLGFDPTFTFKDFVKQL